MKITILGSGSWGIANAVLLDKNGHEVTLWCFSDSSADTLISQRQNAKLLPGVVLSDRIKITTDISHVGACELVVFAVPSFAVHETALKIEKFLHDKQTIVLLSKGFDKQNGYCLLIDTLEKSLPGHDTCVLTGPSHAEEVARGIPTGVVAASRSRAAAELVQAVYMNNAFRVYTTPDVVGAELGGAMKNIMALAVGISDGRGMGDNTKAMLMTRGIAEMARFGVALGGLSETFAGLSGTGDLIVTCISQHSRNRRMGLLIGAGKSPEDAIAAVGAVCEGFFAAEAVYHLSKHKNLDLPISNAIYSFLYEGKSLEDVVIELFAREKKGEIEESWMSHISW